MERNRLRRRIGIELELERGGEAAAVEQVAGGPEVHVGVGEEAGAVARDHERDHDGDDRDDAETHRERKPVAPFPLRDRRGRGLLDGQT